MNRKLHNSLIALVASCGLLAAGLRLAAPEAPPADALAGSAQLLDDSGDAHDGRGGHAPAPQPGPRRGRPSASMPFFSFAPRG